MYNKAMNYQLVGFLAETMGAVCDRMNLWTKSFLVPLTQSITSSNYFYDECGCENPEIKL